MTKFDKFLYAITGPFVIGIAMFPKSAIFLCLAILAATVTIVFMNMISPIWFFVLVPLEIALLFFTWIVTWINGPGAGGGGFDPSEFDDLEEY